MPNLNEDVILKTITQSPNMLFGGLLQPEQQDRYVTLVKNNSTMLKAARFHQMSSERAYIDRMHIGQPVTRRVSENTNTPVDGKVVFSQIRLDAQKMRSDWSVSTEVIQNNITGSGFEDTLMENISKRIATDLEIRAIQADVNSLNPLLDGQDGWDKITDAAHIYNANGSFVTDGILKAAYQSLPSQYLQDPDLRWIVSQSVAIDWSYQIGQRQTDLGDSSLSGTTNKPFGVPMFVVPNLPSNKNLIIGQDSPAQLVAPEFGPYTVIQGTNDLLNIQVNAINAVEITLNAGVYTPVELANQIRVKLLQAGVDGIATEGALLIRDNIDGQISFTTLLVGATAEINILATSIPGQNFADELGIAVPTTVNGVTGAGGNVNEGSFIWLANPKNFIFGMLDETRVYTEFNKDFDRYETVVFNQVAMAVENVDAIVKITNLRTGIQLV